ncbi:MAG TPA: Gfo/Idh/MocA family oxidoreductase [Polyangiaceae bacterium]|jgi:predicted dehydrogenase
MPPVSLVVAGAGGRGSGYAGFALTHPDRAKVVGVAEPRDHYRNTFAAEHSIPSRAVFTSWEELAAQPKMADGVIIATQDRMHAEPAVAFAEKGYQILLEKPMAPIEEDCRRIVAAVQRAGVLFAVCHVMRYTNYTRVLKHLLAEGAVGKIMSIQHLEPVGYWHQAHSFVRGNWRNEALSSPMLLAKSCHDLDWLRYVMGLKCLRVSSFGSLTHLRADQKPAGAADRCLDCEIEPRCPYSAKKLYLGMIRDNQPWWPVDVITTDLTEAGVLEALRTGPYGRCVYACDNDVVDHQVVNLEFEGGPTASFTMTAFTQQRDRETRIFGTHGELSGNGSEIKVFDFVTDKTREIDVHSSDASILGGHGGGDYGLMDSFIDAVAKRDPSLVLSGPEESLETHLMVFAAERARREGRVVSVN